MPWRPGPAFLLSLEADANGVIPESPDLRNQILEDNNVNHAEGSRRAEV